jgi:hypothetical protein
MYEPWTIDKKAQTATLALFGGELVVSRDEAGKPIARWEGEVPTTAEDVARVKARHPDDPPLGPTSRPQLTTFLHFLPSVVAAMDHAPACVRQHLKQVYPHFWPSIAEVEEPAKLITEREVAPPDPF